MSKRHHIVANLETGEFTMTPMKARTHEEARAEMEALMDDCPLCQEARARGEVARIITPFFGSATRLKRPRWGELKKRVRR